MGFKQRIDSFRYAGVGIWQFFSNEIHAKVHLFAAVIALGLAYYFSISRQEWINILLCIALVISLEMVNSALENLTDLASPDYHPLAGKAKDLAAGAVLWASIFAAFIGAIVFWPYILRDFF